MSNRRDHRCPSVCNRHRHGFGIETPEILERTTATTDNENVELGSIEFRDRAGDILGSPLTLDESWTEDDVEQGESTVNRREHVLQSRTRL